MRSVFAVLAASVSVLVLACGVAVADTVTTDFEAPAYHTGTINGQGVEPPWPANIHCAGSGAPPDCWKSAVPGNIPSLPNGYDQAVVTNAGAPGAFGLQSLRHSNAYNPAADTSPPEYFYQTYSKPTAVHAGESQDNKEYTAQFSFISIHPDRQQPGLKMDVSPDNGERAGGERMSYIGLRDTESGIAVTFFDTPGGKFVGHELGTLNRAVPHTIKFWMKLNPGPDNDLVRIFIDDRDVGECFTTWEEFYRRSNQQVPTSTRLLFRSTGAQVIENLIGGGYLFDNVTTTTANGPGPKDCSEEDIVIDKDTQTRFASPGDLVTYRITVRNRGDDPMRRLRACDRPPRALRFVRSTHRLRRAAGGRLCLMIPALRPGERRTFRATFRLRANVTADSVTNGAIADTPSGSAPSTTPPEDAAVKGRRRRVARDSATIGVRGESAACPAAMRPRARAAC